MNARSIVDRGTAQDRLLEHVERGDKLFVTVKHVARSGMSRDISVFKVTDNRPQHLSLWAASALGLPYTDDRDAVRVSGCGMDMGFHLVSALAEHLFGDYKALTHVWL